MKRILLSFALLVGLAFAGMATGYPQDDLFEDKKDTISIDDMDPVFFEAEEEGTSAGNSTLIIAIVAGVVVIGGAAFFISKKKKK